MKFVTLVAAALVFALPAFAQTPVSTVCTYDNTYDNASWPLTGVACSNGAYGLIDKGYTTLGSLPTFPNLGGAYTVTGWDSPACGTCYNITYTNPSTGASTSIIALAVDYAAEGFNLSEEAMNALTGGQAEDLGKAPVTAVQVDASNCGL